jgi:transporter family-2 protein
MQNISVAWLYPIILAAGALQAFGPPMNGALQRALVNPWLSSVVSFLPIVALLGIVAICLPRPMPSVASVADMPWWAPLGGVVGAFAVIVGLIFVSRVGAGTLAGLTITANIVASLAVDHFGLFGMAMRSMSPGRIAGALLMIGGIALVQRY